MSQKNFLKGRLLKYMSEQGLKNTRQRQVILDTFLRADGHVTLDQLLVLVQQDMPGVGYATVYRTMKLFSEAGVAHERRFHDGQSQYETVDMAHDHHDHLICEECGQIFEFENELIEEQQRVVAEQFGLKLTRHRLVLWGRCVDLNKCQEKKSDSSKS